MDIAGYQYKYFHGLDSIYVYIAVIMYIGISTAALCLISIEIVKLGQDKTNNFLASLLLIAFMTGSFFLVRRIVAQFLNLYPEFKLCNEGIHVRLFNYWFFWKMIPYEKIIDIRKSQKRFYSFPFSSGLDLWILEVDDELTRFHHFLSKVYGTGNETALFIMPSLIDQDVFISRVSKQIGKTID